RMSIDEPHLFGWEFHSIGSNAFCGSALRRETYGLRSFSRQVAGEGVSTQALVGKLQKRAFDLVPVMNFQAREYLLYVIVSGIQGKRKRVSNLLVAQAPRDKQRDLALLWRESRDSGTANQGQRARFRPADEEAD